ncbi:MAG: hypothetical protein HRU75_04440 [Planctomycetia bacterium]|nr:MAG: hypothetical protein HRU75_04440 [Planctomycetia bacterium]
MKPPQRHESAEMSRYWAYLSQQMPELELLPDDAARREMFAFLRKRTSLMGWRFGLYWLGFFLVAMGSTYLGMPALTGLVGWVGLPHWTALLIVVPALIVAFYIGFALLWHRPMVRAMRLELQRRGIQVCVNCGYDCRAQEHRRCPECGRELPTATA